MSHDKKHSNHSNEGATTDENGTSAQHDTDGTLVNPHIPEFMAKAPWYLQQEGQGLKHQQSTRHKSEATYESKRDPYRNYDPSEFQLVLQRAQKAEEERKKIRAKQRTEQRLKKRQQKQEKEQRRLERAKRKEEAEKNGTLDQFNEESSDFSSDTDSDLSENGSDVDDLRESEAHAAVETGVQRYSTKNKQTVRNLRVREDTAKYLLNLDLNSAFYDPKTRSMRADPLPHIPAEEKTYAGDNTFRQSNESSGLAKSQLFAWEAYNHGKDIHVQANPTQVEIMQREFQKKKEKLKEMQKQKLLAKYGGEKHLQTLPKELLYGQTENYVRYGADGRVVEGAQNSTIIPSSRYEEDIFPSNHTSIFGSWFDLRTFKWGYKCCNQIVMNSYCTGESGIRAHELSIKTQSKSTGGNDPNLNTTNTTQEKPPMSLMEMRQNAIARGETIESTKGKGYERAPKEEDLRPWHTVASRDTDLNLDTKQVNSAIREFQTMQSETDKTKTKDELANMNAEQIEAYKVTKIHKDDPMASYIEAKQHTEGANDTKEDEKTPMDVKLHTTNNSELSDSSSDVERKHRHKHHRHKHHRHHDRKKHRHRRSSKHRSNSKDHDDADDDASMDDDTQHNHSSRSKRKRHRHSSKRDRKDRHKKRRKSHSSSRHSVHDNNTDSSSSD